MKALAILLLVVTAGYPAPRSRCGCQKLQQGSPTMGNQIVYINGGRLRKIQGTVFYPNSRKPVNEAIIEVYENHSQFRDENIPYQEASKIIAQARKLACMSEVGGRFCFTGLRPGNYLLRVGTHGQDEISGANVLVTLDLSGKRSSSKSLRIDLNMSL